MNPPRNHPEVSTVRLRALSGKPLADPLLRDLVVAQAAAIAERNSVQLLAIEPDDQAVTITIATNKLVALGYLAELRRSTNTWYEKKYQVGPLWGTAVEKEDRDQP